MTTSTNTTRLTSKEACTLAHQIRRETGCSLAEAFKQAYSSNKLTSSTPLFYTQNDLDKIFSDKVAELLRKGYMIHVPTMSGSQGERAFVTFIKGNTLYRLSMYRTPTYNRCCYDSITTITFGKATNSEEILSGRTFWKDDVETIWSFEAAQVSNWRRDRFQTDRFIPMYRLDECETKAQARVHEKYYNIPDNTLPAKFNKPALAWIKTVKGYKGTKLVDIQKVVKNTENGSYNIYLTKQGKTVCVNTETAK